MTVSVQRTHPIGLKEPKIVQKLVNGIKPQDENVEYTNGLLPVTELELCTVESHDKKSQIDKDAQAVLALRNLIFDICNHNGGGHGGSALGMAAIGVALYKYIMRYNPSNPSWFDRDRFVLSNGGCFP